MKQALGVILTLFTGLALFAATGAQNGRITIHAARILDGLGGEIDNTTVVVEASKIVAVEKKSARKADYELGDVTLLPGGIDTHVHISWHFDQDGKTHDPDKQEEAEHTLPYAMENAYRTLMGGITTVQSIGSPVDKDLQGWIARGIIPGPRVLTSLTPIDEETGDPEAIRKHVRAMAADGADVIKIFASQSIRDGGGPTLTQEQLDAACGEAKTLGLRSAVHAHGPESVRRALEAGCTSIEHGVLLDDQTLQLIAQKGAYFDPNIGLIFQNYFENKEHFLGIGNFTEEGFAKMHDAVPTALQMFQHALKVKNLKIVFGTDAVSGSHGRNFEELIYRVEKGGQSPTAAIISATSLAAESLNLQQQIGSITPGKEADMIALAGNPIVDISAFRHVVFVMKAGRVVKNESPQSSSEHRDTETRR